MILGSAPDARTHVELRFEPLTRADLPMLREWLARPHVAEWWEGPPSPEEMEADYGPSIDGRVSHWCYIVHGDGGAIGFTQAYAPAAFHAEGWWLEEHDPDMRGIDQFLAAGELLGRGIGTAVVRAFVDTLFRDPAVTRVQTDPDPANLRAIRCYEKAGFRAERVVETPDGRALLMYGERRG